MCVCVTVDRIFTIKGSSEKGHCKKVPSHTLWI